MNILLISDSYPPEIRSASHLMNELAEGFEQKGHNVAVVTMIPKFNLTDRKKHQKITIENGVKVVRVWSPPVHKVNFIIRGLDQLLMPLFFYFGIKRFIKHSLDIVLIYTPPLPLGLLGKWLKGKYGAKFILNVQDIFPQNAIDLGIMKNKMIIAFFEKLERNIYNNADAISLHSDGNRVFLSNRKGISLEKTTVIHNFVDTDVFDLANKGGDFRLKFDLGKKLVFLFAGVIGPSQGLDIVIDSAINLQQNEDILFLFVGDGTEKQRLCKIAMDKELNNIRFFDFITKEQYALLLREVDVGLVCLSGQNRTPVVPGKLVGYMAAHLPVIAVLNKESDGHNIIHEACCGFSSVSGDINSFCENILKLANDKELRKKMGENGFLYAKNNFSREMSILRYEKLFSYLGTTGGSQ